jgi:hypothetical protein
MTEIIISSLLIVALAVILLAVKVIFKKNGQFESMHIHDSKPMKDRGILCVIEQDREQRQRKMAVEEKSKRNKKQQ